RRVRSRVDEHTGRKGGRTLGDSAYPAQFRPLSGLFDPCHGPGWARVDANPCSLEHISFSCFGPGRVRKENHQDSLSLWERGGVRAIRIGFFTHGMLRKL